MTGDLVVVALPGVQRFVQQSRRTGDLRAASEIVASLARVAVDTIASNGGELVIPTTAERAGVPNRVVALVPAGAGSGVARTVEADVAARWRGWLHRLFPDREMADEDGSDPRLPVPVDHVANPRRADEDWPRPDANPPTSRLRTLVGLMRTR